MRAAARIDFPFKIYCTEKSFPKAQAIPKNVEILSGNFPFEQICKDVSNARIVLIPLAPRPETTVGLMSLLEAMALGKPVLMTKNDKIDLLFDKENIGIEIEEQDVDGWVSAVTDILADYEKLRVMGENSLRLARDRYNIDIFAKNVASVLIRAHEDQRARN